MSPSSHLLKTAATYFEAISTLDPALLSSVLADDYEHTFAPQSAGFGAGPDRAGTIARFASLQAVLSSFPTRMKQTWPNEEARQVTVWATSEANFHPRIKQDDGDEAWSFHGEYMFVLTMDASGEKISSVFEFVDSKSTDGMVKLVGKAFERAKSS